MDVDAPTTPVLTKSFNPRRLRMEELIASEHSFSDSMDVDRHFQIAEVLNRRAKRWERCYKCLLCMRENKEKTYKLTTSKKWRENHVVRHHNIRLGNQHQGRSPSRASGNSGNGRRRSSQASSATTSSTQGSRNKRPRPNADEFRQSFINLCVELQNPSLVQNREFRSLIQELNEDCAAALPREDQFEDSVYNSYNTKRDEIKLRLSSLPAGTFFAVTLDSWSNVYCWDYLMVNLHFSQNGEPASVCLDVRWLPETLEDIASQNEMVNELLDEYSVSKSQVVAVIAPTLREAEYFFKAPQKTRGAAPFLACGSVPRLIKRLFISLGFMPAEKSASNEDEDDFDDSFEEEEDASRESAVQRQVRELVSKCRSLVHFFDSSSTLKQALEDLVNEENGPQADLNENFTFDIPGDWVSTYKMTKCVLALHPFMARTLLDGSTLLQNLHHLFNLSELKKLEELVAIVGLFDKVRLELARSCSHFSSAAYLLPCLEYLRQHLAKRQPESSEFATAVRTQLAQELALGRADIGASLNDNMFLLAAAYLHPDYKRLQFVEAAERAPKLRRLHDYFITLCEHYSLSCEDVAAVPVQHQHHHQDETGPRAAKRSRLGTPGFEIDVEEESGIWEDQSHVQLAQRLEAEMRRFGESGLVEWADAATKQTFPCLSAVASVLGCAPGLPVQVAQMSENVRTSPRYEIEGYTALHLIFLRENQHIE